VQGGTKLIQRTSAGTNGSPLRVIEREEIAELERGQLAWKLVLAEEGELPRLHTGAPNAVCGFSVALCRSKRTIFCELAESHCFT
jgi:hypothetical protein